MGKPTTPRSRYRLLASALVNRARGAELCSSRDLPSGRRRPERLVTASRDQIRPERVRRPTACGRGVFQTAAVRANRGRTMSGVQATQRSRSRLWLSHSLGKSAARQSRTRSRFRTRARCERKGLSYATIRRRMFLICGRPDLWPNGLRRKGVRSLPRVLSTPNS
jgi:hypothetical protein